MIVYFKMSIEEKLINIYKAVTTSSVSTSTVTTASEFLLFSTDRPSKSTDKEITPQIVFRSPSTEINDKFDIWLLIILLVIALCLLFFVFLILYCYFFCFKRKLSSNAIQMSDISEKKHEVDPVVVDPVVIVEEIFETETVAIKTVNNSNRKSLAETFYTIPSTNREMSDILTDDLSDSDFFDIPETNLKRNKTFTIID